MKRTTIFVDEGHERDLDALAVREKRPKAALVREAIAEYLVRKMRDRRVPRFVGAGSSGRPDGAETHEEELFGGLRPHESGAGADATGAARDEKSRA